MSESVSQSVSQSVSDEVRRTHKRQTDNEADTTNKCTWQRRRKTKTKHAWKTIEQ